MLFAAGIPVLALSMPAYAQVQPQDDACKTGGPCAVSEGGYLWVAPPDWDGRKPLPVLIFFHGHSSSAREVAGYEILRQLAASREILIIAPDGRGGTWSHTGSPSRLRDEIAFMSSVLDDVVLRFSPQKNRIFASGFSQGGSMAWNVACYMSGRVAAIAPIAGVFWKPEPDECPAGPIPVRHSHGTADRTMPLGGRSIRQIFHQGDVMKVLATRRSINGCAALPDSVKQEGALTCSINQACTSGAEVRLCLHDGGHDLRDDDVTQAVDWLLKLPASKIGAQQKASMPGASMPSRP
jgi:polyhydroxybutyrate depolymerase